MATRPGGAGAIDIGRHEFGGGERGGRDYGGGFGGFGRDYGPGFGAVGRDFGGGVDLGRDYGRDFGREFGGGAGFGVGRDFGGYYGGRDYGGYPQGYGYGQGYGGYPQGYGYGQGYGLRDVDRYRGEQLGGGWHTDYLQKGTPITWNPRDDRTLYSPRMDCYEDDDNIYVTAEMPGMSKERLDLDVWGDERRKMLLIRGEIEQKVEEGRYTYLQRERVPPTGVFRRHIFLPDYAQTDRIEAKLDAGILTVTIPKAGSGTQTGMRKKIEIRDRAGERQDVHAKVVPTTTR